MENNNHELLSRENQIFISTIYRKLEAAFEKHNMRENFLAFEPQITDQNINGNAKFFINNCVDILLEALGEQYQVLKHKFIAQIDIRWTILQQNFLFNNSFDYAIYIYSISGGAPNVEVRFQYNPCITDTPLGQQNLLTQNEFMKIKRQTLDQLIIELSEIYPKETFLQHEEQYKRMGFKQIVKANNEALDLMTKFIWQNSEGLKNFISNSGMNDIANLEDIDYAIFIKHLLMQYQGVGVVNDTQIYHNVTDYKQFSDPFKFLMGNYFINSEDFVKNGLSISRNNQIKQKEFQNLMGLLFFGAMQSQQFTKNMAIQMNRGDQKMSRSEQKLYAFQLEMVDNVSLQYLQYLTKLNGQDNNNNNRKDQKFYISYPSLLQQQKHSVSFFITVSHILEKLLSAIYWRALENQHSGSFIKSLSIYFIQCFYLLPVIWKRQDHVQGEGLPKNVNNNKYQKTRFNQQANKNISLHTSTRQQEKNKDKSFFLASTFVGSKYINSLKAANLIMDILWHKVAKNRKIAEQEYGNFDGLLMSKGLYYGRFNMQEIMPQEMKQKFTSILNGQVKSSQSLIKEIKRMLEKDENSEDSTLVTQRLVTNILDREIWSQIFTVGMQNLLGRNPALTFTITFNASSANLVAQKLVSHYKKQIDQIEDLVDLTVYRSRATVPIMKQKENKHVQEPLNPAEVKKMLELKADIRHQASQTIVNVQEYINQILMIQIKSQIQRYFQEANISENDQFKGGQLGFGAYFTCLFSVPEGRGQVDDQNFSDRTTLRYLQVKGRVIKLNDDQNDFLQSVEAKQYKIYMNYLLTELGVGNQKRRESLFINPDKFFLQRRKIQQNFLLYKKFIDYFRKGGKGDSWMHLLSNEPFYKITNETLQNEAEMDKFIINLFKCVIEQAIDIILYGESEDNELETDQLSKFRMQDFGIHKLTLTFFPTTMIADVFTINKQTGIINNPKKLPATFRWMGDGHNEAQDQKQKEQNLSTNTRQNQMQETRKVNQRVFKDKLLRQNLETPQEVKEKDEALLQYVKEMMSGIKKQEQSKNKKKKKNKKNAKKEEQRVWDQHREMEEQKLMQEEEEIKKEVNAQIKDLIEFDIDNIDSDDDDNNNNQQIIQRIKPAQKKKLEQKLIQKIQAKIKQNVQEEQKVLENQMEEKIDKRQKEKENLEKFIIESETVQKKIMKIIKQPGWKAGQRKQWEELNKHIVDAYIDYMYNTGHADDLGKELDAFGMDINITREISRQQLLDIIRDLLERKVALMKDQEKDYEEMKDKMSQEQIVLYYNMITNAELLYEALTQNYQYNLVGGDQELNDRIETLGRLKKDFQTLFYNIIKANQPKEKITQRDLKNNILQYKQKSFLIKLVAYYDELKHVIQQIRQKNIAVDKLIRDRQYQIDKLLEEQEAEGGVSPEFVPEEDEQEIQQLIIENPQQKFQEVKYQKQQQKQLNRILEQVQNVEDLNPKEIQQIIEIKSDVQKKIIENDVREEQKVQQLEEQQQKIDMKKLQDLQSLIQVMQFSLENINSLELPGGQGMQRQQLLKEMKEYLNLMNNWKEVLNSQSKGIRLLQLYIALVKKVGIYWQRLQEQLRKKRDKSIFKVRQEIIEKESQREKAERYGGPDFVDEADILIKTMLDKPEIQDMLIKQDYYAPAPPFRDLDADEQEEQMMFLEGIHPVAPKWLTQAEDQLDQLEKMFEIVQLYMKFKFSDYFKKNKKDEQKYLTLSMQMVSDIAKVREDINLAKQHIEQQGTELTKELLDLEFLNVRKLTLGALMEEINSTIEQKLKSFEILLIKMVDEFNNNIQKQEVLARTVMEIKNLNLKRRRGQGGGGGQGFLSSQIFKQVFQFADQQYLLEIDQPNQMVPCVCKIFYHMFRTSQALRKFVFGDSCENLRQLIDRHTFADQRDVWHDTDPIRQKKIFQQTLYEFYDICCLLLQQTTNNNTAAHHPSERKQIEFLQSLTKDDFHHSFDLLVQILQSIKPKDAREEHLWKTDGNYAIPKIQIMDITKNNAPKEFCQQLVARYKKLPYLMTSNNPVTKIRIAQYEFHIFIMAAKYSQVFDRKLTIQLQKLQQKSKFYEDYKEFVNFNPQKKRGGGGKKKNKNKKNKKENKKNQGLEMIEEEVGEETDQEEAEQEEEIEKQLFNYQFLFPIDNKRLGFFNYKLQQFMQNKDQLSVFLKSEGTGSMAKNKSILKGIQHAIESGDLYKNNPTLSKQQILDIEFQQYIQNKYTSDNIDVRHKYSAVLAFDAETTCQVSTNKNEVNAMGVYMISIHGDINLYYRLQGQSTPKLLFQEKISKVLMLDFKHQSNFKCEQDMESKKIESDFVDFLIDLDERINNAKIQKQQEEMGYVDALQAEDIPPFLNEQELIMLEQIEQEDEEGNAAEVKERIKKQNQKNGKKRKANNQNKIVAPQQVTIIGFNNSRFDNKLFWVELVKRVQRIGKIEQLFCVGDQKNLKQISYGNIRIIDANCIMQGNLKGWCRTLLLPAEEQPCDNSSDEDRRKRNNEERKQKEMMMMMMQEEQQQQQQQQQQEYKNTIKMDFDIAKYTTIDKVRPAVNEIAKYNLADSIATFDIFHEFLAIINTVMNKLYVNQNVNAGNRFFFTPENVPPTLASLSVQMITYIFQQNAVQKGVFLKGMSTNQHQRWPAVKVMIDESYFGGYVQAFSVQEKRWYRKDPEQSQELQQQNDSEDETVYLDVNSEYPAVMQKNCRKFPTEVTNFDNTIDTIFISDLLNPDDILYSIWPSYEREEQKFIYPPTTRIINKASECLEYFKKRQHYLFAVTGFEFYGNVRKKKCIVSFPTRVSENTLIYVNESGVEDAPSYRWGRSIYKAFQRGDLRCIRVQAVVEFKTNDQFDVFEQYIKVMYAMRVEAKKLKQRSKERVIKLILNMLYGKFGMRIFPVLKIMTMKDLNDYFVDKMNLDFQLNLNENQFQFDAADEEDGEQQQKKIKKTIIAPRAVIKTVTPMETTEFNYIGGEDAEIEGGNAVIKDLLEEQKNALYQVKIDAGSYKTHYIGGLKHVASYVTDLARNLLIKYIAIAEETQNQDEAMQLLYCDTDSLICSKRAYNRLQKYVDSSKLGYLKLEVPLNYNWVKFQALAPKVYCYTWEYYSKTFNKVKVKEKRAFKGIMGEELRRKIFTGLKTQGFYLPEENDVFTKWQSREGKLFILEQRLNRINLTPKLQYDQYGMFQGFFKDIKEYIQQWRKTIVLFDREDYEINDYGDDLQQKKPTIRFERKL